MPAAWIGLASAAVGAYSSYSNSKNGQGTQGGTTTQKNEPWAPAQPWMQQNLQTGQNLQNQYAQNPFNAQQLQAYGNLASGNNYINRMTPGLLAQFSQQGGFDRNNPNAKPQAFNFGAPQQNMGAAQSYGGVMQEGAPSSLGFPQSGPQATPQPIQSPQTGYFDTNMNNRARNL